MASIIKLLTSGYVATGLPVVASTGTPSPVAGPTIEKSPAIYVTSPAGSTLFTMPFVIQNSSMGESSAVAKTFACPLMIRPNENMIKDTVMNRTKECCHIGVVDAFIAPVFMASPPFPQLTWCCILSLLILFGRSGGGGIPQSHRKLVVRSGVLIHHNRLPGMWRHGYQLDGKASLLLCVVAQFTDRFGISRVLQAQPLIETGSRKSLSQEPLCRRSPCAYDAMASRCAQVTEAVIEIHRALGEERRGAGKENRYVLTGSTLVRNEHRFPGSAGNRV